VEKVGAVLGGGGARGDYYASHCIIDLYLVAQKLI